MLNQEALPVRPQLLVRHRIEARPRGPQPRHQLRARRRRLELLHPERPLECRPDRCAALLVLVAGRRLVRGNPRLRAEEQVVHRLRRQPRRALAEDPGHRGVEVAVPPEHAQRLHVVGRKLVVRERADLGQRVAPCTLDVRLHQQAERERCHGVREHFADVGAGPQRVPLAGLATDDPWLHTATSVVTSLNGAEGGRAYTSSRPPARAWSSSTAATTCYSSTSPPGTPSRRSAGVPRRDRACGSHLTRLHR